MGNVYTVRKLVQAVSFSLLFLPLWASPNPVWIGSYLASDFLGISLTDPLSALEVTLAGKSIWWPVLWSVLPLAVLALVLGRFFCSWVCPLNTILEWVSVVKKPSQESIANSYLPLRILAGLLIAAFLVDLPLFSMISPIGILGRAILFGIGLEVLLILAIIVAEWLIGSKTWCRRLCPVGAVYGILGWMRCLTVQIHSASCTQCGRCHAACTMKVSVGSQEDLDRFHCTNCGDCVEVCAEHAVQFKLQFNKKGGQTHHESMERITG